MRKTLRRVTLTTLTASLLFAIGLPEAFATQSYCNSDLDACGTLTDQSISNHYASSTAKTFTELDNRKHGVEVIQNFEGDHWYGWTTDQSWQSGNSSDYVTSETATGSFKCGGATYKFYSRHYINGSQFDVLQTNQFTCS